mmetsp:Transcript_116293/g.323965  ORF Transcript_116293/g.323965 Transcript_116293/m.323965 type:complete len:370 (+) Transcript_116293:1231-2340(+)
MRWPACLRALRGLGRPRLRPCALPRVRKALPPPRPWRPPQRPGGGRAPAVHGQRLQLLPPQDLAIATLSRPGLASQVTAVSSPRGDASAARAAPRMPPEVPLALVRRLQGAAAAWAPSWVLQPWPPQAPPPGWRWRCLRCHHRCCRCLRSVHRPHSVRPLSSYRACSPGSRSDSSSASSSPAARACQCALGARPPQPPPPRRHSRPPVPRRGSGRPRSAHLRLWRPGHSPAPDTGPSSAPSKREARSPFSSTSSARPQPAAPPLHRRLRWEARPLHCTCHRSPLRQNPHQRWPQRVAAPAPVPAAPRRPGSARARQRRPPGWGRRRHRQWSCWAQTRTPRSSPGAGASPLQGPQRHAAVLMRTGRRQRP